MKKSFLIVLCTLISICNTYAQSNISWEGQAGLNLSTISTTGYSSRAGFHVGIRGNMPIPSLYNGVYVNAGAFLSLKGASVDMGDLGGGKSNAYYLDIPVHMGYKYNINDNFAVFGEFGPYFDFGLFGKTNTHGIDLDDDYEFVSGSESHNTFDEFKRFDFGLGLRFGMEFHQKYTFSIGYDFGLINSWKKDWIKEEDCDGETINIVGSVKNRNLSITLGYKF